MGYIRWSGTKMCLVVYRSLDDTLSALFVCEMLIVCVVVYEIGRWLWFVFPRIFVCSRDKLCTGEGFCFGVYLEEGVLLCWTVFVVGFLDRVYFAVAVEFERKLRDTRNSNFLARNCCYTLQSRLANYRHQDNRPIPDYPHYIQYTSLFSHCLLKMPVKVCGKFSQQERTWVNCEYPTVL